MRLVGGTAVVVFAAVVVAGCGLGLGGLGETPGDDGGGADVLVADVVAGGDVTVPGDAAGTDAPSDTGVVDAPAETSALDSPAPPPVDAGCPGVVCNGNCTSATDCQGCGGANLLCKGTNACTTDCTACPTSPIQCFACDATRLHPIGTCEPGPVPGAIGPPTTYCLDENYAGAYQGGLGYHCACDTAADCPGNDQVCIGIGTPNPPYGCFTCGEAYTDMFTCKAGPGEGPAKCNEAKASCN